MNEVHDAFSRDPDAIERLRKLVESMEEQRKSNDGPLQAVLARRAGAPAAPWSLADVDIVLKAALYTGRKQGADQCSDAIFGTLTSDQGVPPQLQVLMGGLADDAGGDPEQKN